jgi:hypothetical protein
MDVGNVNSILLFENKAPNLAKRPMQRIFLSIWIFPLRMSRIGLNFPSVMLQNVSKEHCRFKYGWVSPVILKYLKLLIIYPDGKFFIGSFAKDEEMKRAVKIL